MRGRKLLIAYIFFIALLIGKTEMSCIVMAATTSEYGNYADNVEEGPNGAANEDSRTDAEKSAASVNSWTGRMIDENGELEAAAPVTPDEIYIESDNPLEKNLKKIWNDQEKRTKILNQIKDVLKQQRLIVVNYQVVSTDVPPMVVNGRTMVPLRAVSNMLDASVVWDPETNITTIQHTDSLVEINLNTLEVKINGAAVSLEVPVQVVEGRTMVPLRFIAETFRKKVEWDAATSSVFIQ